MTTFLMFILSFIMSSILMYQGYPMWIAFVVGGYGFLCAGIGYFDGAFSK